MFGKPPEEISYFERYLAKYVDFGLIYGRSARSLVEGWEMEYLAQQGGERWTQKQAETFIEKFLGQFPQLKAWLANQERLVHSQHYIETLTGRRRRFPLITPQTRGSAERQARNSPIQSFASDINLSAMIKLHDLLDPREARILYSVYDSISFEIREDVLEKNIDVIKAVMEKPPIPLLVPLRVDVEVGPRWSETKPWEEVKDAYNRMVA
jgi:DNA polymerase-1